MNTEKTIDTLKKIRKAQGDTVFLNADRLSAYILDLSRGQDTQEDLSLLKAAYRTASPQIGELVRSLAGSGNKAGAAAAAEGVKAALTAAFFPPDACRNFLALLFGSFDQNFSSMDDGSMPAPPAVDTARFSAALQALDDKYQDELWKNGSVLSSLLADQDPGLTAERILTERVYSAAGSEIRKLVSLIVKKREENTQVVLIQKLLRADFIDDRYIDAFLTAVLDLFGKEYTCPLSPRDTPHPKDSAGKGNGSAQPAISPVAIKKKSRKGLPGVLLVIILLVFFIPRLFRGDNTASENTEAPASGKAETDQTSENDTDTGTTEESDSAEPAVPENTEPELYYPRTESGISLDSAEATVYGDNITDLRSYSRYEARGKNFTFGYPRNLYTDVNLVSENFDTAYVFTGTDGSYLEYHLKQLTTRYSTGEWREMLTQSLTAGMTDVQMPAYSDGDDEGHFYLTASEGGMDVVIVSTHYVSGVAEWMLLKYPSPTDELDAARKKYLAECLYCLADFSDSSQQGLSLRTFEDFASGN